MIATLLRILAGLALATALTACGGGDPDDGPDVPTPEPGPSVCDDFRACAR